MLVDTINKVKGVSVGYVGSNGLFDSATVNAYTASLRGLSATQAEVALSSAGLDKAQKQQILNKLAETNATISLTSAEATETLTRSLGSKEAANELLIKSGLVTEEQLLAGTTVEVTSAKIADAVATGVLTKEEGAKIATAFGLTGANVGLGTSFKLLAKSIWVSVKAMVAWLFTNPVGWATLAIGAIVGATAAYIKWGDTLDNTREKLADLKSECDSITSNIKSVNGEIETTKQRIAELESKGTLTFTEKEELDNLVKQNNELQRTIDLLKLKQNENQKEKNKAFVSAMEKDVEQHDEYHTDNYTGKIEKGRGGRDKGTGTNEKAYINQQLKDYQENLRQISELNEQYRDDLSNKEYQKEKKRLEDKNKKIAKYINNKNDEFATDAEGIDYIQNPTSEDDKKVNEWLDYINDFQDKMAVAMGGENAKENAFNRIVDNWKFDELLNPLQKLGKEGKVTLDDLKSRMSDPAFAEFVNKLVEIGVISDTTDGSLRYLANAFNGTATSARNYVTALKGNDLNKFVKNLSEEAKALGTTESELAKLTAAHVIFNDTGLSTEQQQQALQMLATKIATTATEMKYLLQLFNVASGNFDAVDGSSTMTEQERRARTVRTRAYLKEKYGIDLSPITIPEKEDDNPYDTDTGTGKSAFDDNYYSLVEAWLEDNKKEIDRLKKEQEDLNRQFENALETGNKDRVEILRAKLTENNKAQKDALHRQNNAHRTTKQDLMESLYQIAPELNGKSWEEISEVDLVSIENRLSNAAEETETSKKNNNKDKAKLQLNTFKGIVEDIKKVDNIIKENSDSWWDADENAKKYWASQIDFQDEYSRNWIENQKSFDKLTDEEELAAYGRMIYNNKEFQKRILNDISLTEEAKIELIKSTNDKILDIEKDAYDKRKELFDSGSDFGDTYIESKKTLLESYYDVTNSIAEAQHEINKELETSKTMYEYLDEDTRKLLFNQEDYNELSEELLDIQYRADKLQRQYKRDLDNSTLETIESITSEYQMQYETLMKSYEVAKADLEIAKKKQKLNNVLNERNVRMFINGSWQWVANTEDVVNAKSELADAEYAKRVEEAGLTQQESINNLTKQQDELSVVIKKFEGGVIDLGEAIKQAEKAIGNMPNALASIFNNAKVGTSSSSYSTGSTVYGGNSGGGSNSSYISWAKSQMAENSKNWHTADENGKRALEAANQSLGNAIGSTFDPATGTWKHKYAMGTKYTKGGSALMGEEGEEFYVSANGRLIPITQPTIGNIPGGGVVFNAEQMKNLRTMWDMSNLRFSGSTSLAGIAQPQQIDQSQDNRIIINGMTVDSGSSDGQALISALRRYVGNH